MSFLKLFALFICVVVLGVWLGFSSVVDAQETITMGILPLVDRTGEHAHWGYFLRDALFASFERTNQFSLVDSLQVDEVLRDSRLPRDTVFVQTTAQVLRQRMGSELLMIGSFRLRDMLGVERFVVSLRIYQADQEGYIELESDVFDLDDIGRMADHFVRKSFQALNLSLPAGYQAVGLDPKTLEPMYLALAKRDEALSTYGDRQFPDHPLWKDAFALAQTALAQEPDFLMGYAYLADMYQKTGWMAKEVETWNILLERLGQAEMVEWTRAAAGRAYLRLAHAYDYQDKTELALHSLESAIRLNPDLAEGYYLMGKIYYDQGETVRAQQYWDEAYRLNPALKEARYFADVAERATMYGQDAYEAYRTGYTYYSAGNLATAEEYFRTAARMNPDMKEAQYWLGRTLYDLGKLEESVAAWQRVVEIDPFDSQARRFLDRSIQESQYGREALNQFRQGFDLYQKGDYQGAIGYFRQAVGLSPVFPEAHDFLARCYYALGATDQYVREREKAIALLQDTQEKGWQYYQVGFELFSWEQPDQAIDYLQRAVQADPSLGDAHLLLGELFAERKRWPEAYQHFSQARQLPLDEEGKGLALWGETVALVQLERWDQAVPLLEEVVTRFPFASYMEEAEALRVESLVKSGQNREARVAYQQFVLRFPQNPGLEKLRFLYGLSFYQDQQYEEAIQALSAFVEQHPGSSFLREANEALGFSYRALGQEEKAQQYFGRLGGEQGTFLAADASYRRKEWAAAVSGFQSYLSEFPQGRYQTEARLKLASSYLEMGEADRAAETIQGHSQAVSRDFPNDYARFRVKLAFEMEQWEAVIEGINRLRELEEDPGADYVFLEALAHDNLGDRERSSAILAEAGEDPEAILVDAESELVREATELVHAGSSEALDRFAQILQEDLSPENRSRVRFLYGKALYSGGDLTGAQEHLVASLETGINDFREEALFYLGDIAYQAEDWSGVIEAYEPLVAQNQGAVLWRTAQGYRNLGREKDARTLLEKLVNHPDYAQRALLWLMEEDYQAGRYQDYLTGATRFLTDYPDHPELEEVLHLSVWAAHRSENEPKARELIGSYLNTFGTEGTYGFDLHYLLADYLVKDGDPEEALNVLRTLEGAVEGERLETVRFRMGTIHLSLERFDQAAFHFERLANDPKGRYYTRAGYLMGACLEYLDRRDDAVAFYQKIIDSGQEDDWVFRCQERLNLLTEQ